jgi:hypothetical protein
MAAEVKVPDNPATTGKKLTKITPVVGNPILFANDGDTLLFVKAGAAESKVKVTVTQKVDGIAVVAREVACKEGMFCLGRFEPSKYNNEEGQVEVSFTVATEIEAFIVKSS